MKTLKDIIEAIPTATHVHAYNLGGWRKKADISVIIYQDNERERLTWDLRGNPKGYFLDGQTMSKDREGKWVDYQQTSSRELPSKKGHKLLLEAIAARRAANRNKRTDFDIFQD